MMALVLTERGGFVMDFLLFLGWFLAIAFGTLAFFLFVRGERIKGKAELQQAVLQQQLQAGEQRMRDWETQQEQAIQHAKAAVLDAGAKLSSKLLEDHKREIESARKDSEALTRKTTEGLMENMQKITQTVATINTQTGDDRKRMDTLYRALSSPTGAGQLGEVALENILKNLGLQKDQDYTIQYSVTSESGRLRPDAVIYLPQDRVMVIDAKSSKYLLGLAEAEGSPKEAEVTAQFRQTMRKHLDDLSRKDYRSVVEADLRALGRRGQVAFSVMLLPTEKALDVLCKADPEFLSKADKAGLILATPQTLRGLCTLASMDIALARKADYQEEILHLTEQVMGGMITLFEHAGRVGSGIKTSADNFAKFTTTANSMLRKLHRLAGKGLQPASKKPLPDALIGYEVRQIQDASLIDAIAEEVEDTPALHELKKISA